MSLMLHTFLLEYGVVIHKARSEAEQMHIVTNVYIINHSIPIPRFVTLCLGSLHVLSTLSFPLTTSFNRAIQDLHHACLTSLHF